MRPNFLAEFINANKNLEMEFAPEFVILLIVTCLKYLYLTHHSLYTLYIDMHNEQTTAIKINQGVNKLDKIPNQYNIMIKGKAIKLTNKEINSDMTTYLPLLLHLSKPKCQYDIDRLKWLPTHLKQQLPPPTHQIVPSIQPR